MKERFRQKEIPATEADIEQAVEGWWGYLDRKMQVHPHLAKGIVPRLVHDQGLHSESSRTVKFSLVDTMAPELADLAYIVGPVEHPHIYIEGTRSPDIVVKFSEIYSNTPKERLIFRADSHNKFPTYLKNSGMASDRFLLHITSDNEMWTGSILRHHDIPVIDLVFLTDRDNVMRAYALQGGWHSLHLGTLKRALYMGKNKKIRQATRNEIEIVKTGFSKALSALG